MPDEPGPDEQPAEPETPRRGGSRRRPRPTRPGHDEQGLDLARLITRSLAQAAGRAPRRRGRPGRPESPADRRRGGLSGARPDDRDPQLVGPTLDKLVSDRGWEVDLKVQAVFGRWAELVGAEVAAHTTPEAFADGKLVVRTDSTAWAVQLRLLAPTVVRRLNEELGHGTVTLLDVAGPARAVVEEGPAQLARRSRTPRHLRLRSDPVRASA